MWVYGAETKWSLFRKTFLDICSWKPEARLGKVVKSVLDFAYLKLAAYFAILMKQSGVVKGWKRQRYDAMISTLFFLSQHVKGIWFVAPCICTETVQLLYLKKGPAFGSVLQLHFFEILNCHISASTDFIPFDRVPQAFISICPTVCVCLSVRKPVCLSVRPYS